MNYQVKQQFGRGSENQIGYFVDLKKAIEFVHEKLAGDALYKVNAIYKIYEDEMVIEEWTQEKWQKLMDQQAATSSDSSSSTSGSKSTFSPTPIPTSPRPPGTPPPSWKRDEDDEKK